MPNATAPRLIDPFARALTYLRVSVTDPCDFPCVYCMSENMTFLPQKKPFDPLEELDPNVFQPFIRAGRSRKLRNHPPAKPFWCRPGES